MRIALGLLMALRFSVWPGCSSASLRCPASLTVRPLHPVVAFVACDSPCTRTARRPKGVTSGRLPDSVRRHIRVANCARIMPDQPQSPWRPSFLGAPARAAVASLQLRALAIS
jgi:hypothetical protein